MRLISCLTLAIIFAAQGNNIECALADDRRPVLSGELNYEDTTEKAADSYSTTQTQVIEYFKNFESTLTAATPAPDLTEAQLNYLDAAFLYCSINNGKCPYILDAILEIDIKRSAINHVAACPTMTKFWKQWVANDMENRHKYAVRTAFLSVTEEFRTKDRPKYLKCKETVATEIAGASSLEAFFSARYAPNSEKRRAIARTIEYLEAVQASGQNLITALGIKSESSKDEVQVDSKSKSKSATKPAAKKPPVKSHH